MIFKRFIKKLKDDDTFFNYENLSEEEIEVLVEDHLEELLEQALDEIYDNGLPQIDLRNKDEVKQEFNFKLTKTEISLLVNLMYQKYSEEDKNKLKAMQVLFRSNEMNVFSPANERTSFNKMVKEIIKENKKRISNYLARDRKTGKIII